MKEDFIKYLEKIMHYNTVAMMLYNHRNVKEVFDFIFNDKLKVNRQLIRNYIDIKNIVNDFRRKEIQIKWNKRKLERKLKIKNIIEKRSKI